MSRPRMETLPGVAPPDDGAEVLASLDEQPRSRTVEQIAELEAYIERRNLSAKWLNRALAREMARQVSP